MLLYCHTLTPRLRYVTDFISQYFSYPLKVTANEQTYITSTDSKINYSYHRIADEELYIKPTPLLSETEKRKFNISCFQHNGYTAFFKTDGDLGFDLFAGIFYLLSRYEEYLPHQKDQYGRYAHQNAIAYREGFLQLPLVNIWLEDFRKLLQEKFPELSLPLPSFQFVPTYDIDIAWCYKHKGFKKNFGTITKFILKGRFGKASQVIKVLKGKREDPYDSYEWLDQLHNSYNLHPIYFFLVPEQKGRFDKNIDINIPAFQELISTTASKYETGLHPSWASGDHKTYLGKEKQFLEKLTQRPISLSRQHYIRMGLPQTYRFLLDSGITHEYSMGYGSINGFRASVATSFYWYDLSREEQTNLLVHPFCFMDANAYYEQGQTAEQALEEALHYYQTVKSVNGQLITIWHNNFVGTAEEFEGWREAYENFVMAVAKPTK